MYGFGQTSRECGSILETRPQGAPGRDKPVPYGERFDLPPARVEIG